MRVFFLSADVPLTKSFLADGTKSDYPLVNKFTSHEEEVSTSKELFEVISAHAKKQHCLIKGQLSRPLVHESRKNTTSTDEATQWVCLDFDRHEASDIDKELAKIGLGDVSYVLQYSSSHGMADNDGTISAHVFMLLNKPLPAPTLKAWLMDINLKQFRSALRLSRMKSVISWPLDITTCQNDKILYIAPPIFQPPQKDPLQKRISHKAKKLDAIPIERIGETHIATLKTDERKVLNDLRKAEGLPVRTAKTIWVGGVEVHNKPDESTVTGQKDCGEYIRLNLNGGDSWAYWHSKDNFELINDFKSDSWFRTKELLPGYYKQLVAAREALNATPSATGDLILAFRDKITATYYNGLWNPGEQYLEIHAARNETMLDHWMQSHGRTLGAFIPIWTIEYLPKEDWIVKEDDKRINTFRFSDYMRIEPVPRTQKSFPTIHKIIKHVLGEDDLHHDLSDHWYNWFACIMQRKHKPLTAWVLHGIEGTGKGYLFNKIITPILHPRNTIAIGISNLEDNFNDFMEGKLLTLVDEVDVDDFKEKGRMSAKLRSWITEPTMPMRRMRQSAIQLPNYNSFMFSSNRPQPVFIPETDRRYNVGNFQSEKLMPPNDEKVEQELQAFAEFLLSHKASIERANTVLQTEARARIAKLGMTSIAEICRDIKEGDFDKLWIARPDERMLAVSGIVNEVTSNASAYGMLMRDIAAHFDSVITREEMYIIIKYHVGGIGEQQGKFTKLLSHNGIELKRVSKHGRKMYGIPIKWKVSDEIREEIKQTLTPSKPALRKV